MMASTKLLFADCVVQCQQVRPKSLGWLRGHLDSALKDRFKNGNNKTKQLEEQGNANAYK